MQTNKQKNHPTVQWGKNSGLKSETCSRKPCPIQKSPYKTMSALRLFGFKKCCNMICYTFTLVSGQVASLHIHCSSPEMHVEDSNNGKRTHLRNFYLGRFYVEYFLTFTSLHFRDCFLYFLQHYIS